MRDKFKKNKLMGGSLFIVALILGLEMIYIALWMIQSALLFIPALVLIALCGHEIRRAFMGESRRYKLPWFFALAVNSALGVISIMLITVILTVSYTFTEVILRLIFLGMVFGISLVATLKAEYWRGKMQPTNNQTPEMVVPDRGRSTNILIITSIILAFLITVFLSLFEEEKPEE